MRERQLDHESIEYRIAVVESGSGNVLTFQANGNYRLPRVRISRNVRHVSQLAKMIEDEWGVKVMILDFLSEPDNEIPCAAAIVLGSTSNRPALHKLSLEQLPPIELPEKERDCLVSIIYGRSICPLSRIDWFDVVIAWVEEVTGKKISSKADVEQLNAGGGYALIRFGMGCGDTYWLKATGEPNRHECALTTFLSSLCPTRLPHIIAHKTEWNAWLTADAGSCLRSSPAEEAMECAADGFANLQIHSRDSIGDLFAAGAFDQRPHALRKSIGMITDYLIQAMEYQESTKVPVLQSDRLLKVAEVLRRACLSLEELEIPDTLLHNDLSRSNILFDHGGCRFIDWSEASIGNPFLGCERLCQLNQEHQRAVQSIYRSAWSERIDAKSIDKALNLAPLLAIYAYLYGRGSWPRVAGVQPHFDSYARSLARHMDRAAQNLELQGASCL
jgi:Phosphotransferase enzyme family